MKLFLDLFQPTAAIRILDVGGHPSDWENNKEVTSRITFVNVVYPHVPRPNPRFECIVGDGRKLDFPDQAFDIVFSNSVIEHVGSLEDQRKFASEVRRVGRKVFVQTPNRRFPIEPHFGACLIHLLPGPLARFLLCHFSFRAWFRKGDNVDLRQVANELRLLTFDNMRELFPDCEIHREKLFGLTKSLIASTRRA
jgi:hypothetical protein